MVSSSYILEDNRINYTTREQISGVILSSWADEAATDIVNIWRFNGESAEDLTSEINLADLGGLVISFANQASDYEHKKYLRTCNSTIDLSFGELAYRVLSTDLLGAAELQLGKSDVLSQQLRHRTTPTDLHGNNEIWFIPTNAVQLIASKR